MSAIPKVSIYSVPGKSNAPIHDLITTDNPYPDLKNTTDDALPNYLTSLKFEQNHKTTDVRLVLGYTAVAIAGALFYYDWKFGWEHSKPFTLPAVAIYFLLNGAFTYWVWAIEANQIFSGTHKTNGTTIILSTKADSKYRPVYKVIARWTKAKNPYESGAQWKEVTLRAPFTRWFTSDGYFVAKPFQQWLASGVEAVGEADPNNVVEEIGRGSESEKQTASTGPKIMNVDINNLSDVLGAIQGQAQGAAKQRKQG